MMYDLAEEPPPAGSLLESLFLLTAKRRQESEFHKTRALIAAMVSPHVENGGKALLEALEVYKGSVFPFLGKDKTDEEAKLKKVLKKWTQDIEAIKIRPLWTMEERKKMGSRLKRGAEKVQRIEEEKKSTKYKRI